jgi:hypothetical protein
MWRSIFLAIGVTFCILGLECLVVDEAVLASPNAGFGAATAMDGYSGNAKQIKTEEWMPWGFLGAGAVIILYSITIPKRFQT